METINEVKRTQGKWDLIRKLNDPEFSHEIGLSVSDKDAIACVFGFNKPYKEAEANAEFICRAVNEYDKLKADNEMLLENLKRLVDRLEENDFGHMSAVIRAKAAIKQAESK